MYDVPVTYTCRYTRNGVVIYLFYQNMTKCGTSYIILFMCYNRVSMCDSHVKWGGGKEN